MSHKIKQENIFIYRMKYDIKSQLLFIIILGVMFLYNENLRSLVHFIQIDLISFNKNTFVLQLQIIFFFTLLLTEIAIVHLVIHSKIKYSLVFGMIIKKRLLVFSKPVSWWFLNNYSWIYNFYYITLIWHSQYLLNISYVF